MVLQPILSPNVAPLALDRGVTSPFRRIIVGITYESRLDRSILEFYRGRYVRQKTWVPIRYPHGGKRMFLPFDGTDLEFPDVEDATERFRRLLFEGTIEEAKQLWDIEEGEVLDPELNAKVRFVPAAGNA